MHQKYAWNRDGLTSQSIYSFYLLIVLPFPWAKFSHFKVGAYIGTQIDTSMQKFQERDNDDETMGWGKNKEHLSYLLFKLRRILTSGRKWENI